MRKLLNSLYILEETAYLTLDGENIVCRAEDSEKFRVPFGLINALVSTIVQGRGQREVPCAFYQYRGYLYFQLFGLFTCAYGQVCRIWHSR